MCMSLLGNSHHIWLPPLGFASKKEGVLPRFFPEQSEHGCSWRGALSSWYLTDFIPPWLCSPHPDGVQPPFFTYLVWPQIFNHEFWTRSNHSGSRGEDEQLRKEKVVVTPTCGDLSAEMSACSVTSCLSVSITCAPWTTSWLRTLEIRSFLWSGPWVTGRAGMDQSNSW